MMFIIILAWHDEDDLLLYVFLDKMLLRTASVSYMTRNTANYTVYT